MARQGVSAWEPVILEAEARDTFEATLYLPLHTETPSNKQTETTKIESIWMTCTFSGLPSRARGSQPISSVQPLRQLAEQHMFSVCGTDVSEAL